MRRRICLSLPAEEVRWAYTILNRVRQLWTMLHPIITFHHCSPSPLEPGREGGPYFVSSSLSFSVSCLSSSFSPSFSFSFSFSSFSSWLLRGICCCCKTKDIK